MRLSACVLIVLTGLVVAGCSRTMPVYNVSSAPVVTQSGRVSTDQVRGAIIAALADKRWMVKQDDPGKIIAEVDVRRHSATVDIDYSATAYDITYSDSTLLMYDGSSIHRNYNKWVMLLEEQINRRLSEI